MPVMARSPTHAFDPTPALEHNRQNYSPLNDLSNGQKEVHFSDRPTIMSQGARHSIATTNVPLLSSVPSASKIPKQAFRINAPPPNIDLNAYIENCRNLNEQLRQAHETERKAWDIERSALQSRIADLEFTLNKSRDTRRRSSNESSGASAQSDARTVHHFAASTSRKPSETSQSSAPPVWQGPESTPPVTRVFSNENDLEHLPSISEDEPFPSLSKEVSPKDASTRSNENIDKSLDGVTLKSAVPAFASNFTAKVISPQGHSPNRSPSPRGQVATRDDSLRVDMSGLLSPLDEKLKRNAGHTPMAFSGELSTSANTTTGIVTPKNETEDPPEPAPTTRPPVRPVENSDSYFSFDSDTKPHSMAVDKLDDLREEGEGETELQDPADDPSLKGPLMLDANARTEASNVFLDKLDQKLMEAASSSNTRFRSDSVLSGESMKRGEHPVNDNNEQNGNGEAGEKKEGQEPEAESDRPQTSGTDDGMPRLKLKQSMNFGSAWGGGVPGKI